VSPPRDDGDLIAAVLGGERDAFAELFRRHADRVRTHLTRLVGPVAERDDLVQEIFLRLHQALPSYRGDCALPTYLHRVTVNAALDHLRSAGRRHIAPWPDEAIDSLLEPGVSESARAQARDELRRLFRLLDQISTKKRLAFLLVAVEGLSLAEAAAAVGASADAVKQRVLTARRELEALIEAENGAEGSR
jgi:RNA polymerase sigma-70 factor (ECF subfamily)